MEFQFPSMLIHQRIHLLSKYADHQFTVGRGVVAVMPPAELHNQFRLVAPRPRHGNAAAVFHMQGGNAALQFAVLIRIDQ